MQGDYQAMINYKNCGFTIIDFETDIFKGGVIAALDLSQNLHDAFHFGTLELDGNDT